MCKYCGTGRDDDTWLIGPDGGVKNVVVFLSDIKSGKKMTAAQKLTLNQIHCRYVPRMSVVGQGATLEMNSSDPVPHNVHSYVQGSTFFNVAVPPAQRINYRIEAGDRLPARIACSGPVRLRERGLQGMGGWGQGPPRA